jgi:hypothetical protein
MPERSAIEACLMPLSNPTSDPDIAFLHLLGCQQQVAAGLRPVPVTMTISIKLAQIGTEVMTEVKVKREPVDAETADPKLLKIETEFSCDVIR